MQCSAAVPYVTSTYTFTFSKYHVSDVTPSYVLVTLTFGKARDMHRKIVALIPSVALQLGHWRFNEYRTVSHRNESVIKTFFM